MKELFVLDSKSTLWQYNYISERYFRVGGSDTGLTLIELDDDHGPLSGIKRGDVVKVPRSIADGTWVEFDVDDLSMMAGRVKSYNTEKQYYEVIVTVGQQHLRETL